MSTMRDEARQYLATLRKGPVCGHYGLIEYIRELVREGYSLEEFGTTEKELNALWVEGYKASALRWLERLRQGVNYSACLEFFWEDVKNGGLAISSLNFNGAKLDCNKLEALRLEGCMRSARQYLAIWRLRCPHRALTAQFLFRELALGKLSLEDARLGATDEEIESLQMYSHNTETV